MKAAISRRQFTLLAAAAMGASALRGTAQPGGLSVQDVLSRLPAQGGASPGSSPASSLDGLKAGSVAMPVRGVAVTAMATVDVLRQAAEAGTNLVITFEPTFFGRNDGQPVAAVPGRGPGGRGGPGNREVAQDDPVLLAKRKLIADNGMAVLRYHDALLEHRQVEMARALGQELGWAPPPGDSGLPVYTLQPTSLLELVAQIKQRGAVKGGLRVVGKKTASVRRVAVLPGLQPLPAIRSGLATADLVVVGESRDWEAAEYAGDATAAGMNKSLISLGRVVSEDPGMHACAGWVQSLLPEVPVHWIATGDPFWRPS